MKLEIGYKAAFEVRHEKICLPIANSVSILFISDLHFSSFSGTITARLIQTIERLKPDIILLGGDYIDFPGGRKYFRNLLNAISHNKNIFAIWGNHDHFWGIQWLKQTMESYGITCMEKESKIIRIGSVTLRIGGGSPLTPVVRNTDLAVLFVHQPIDPEPYRDDYQLIFAGHLHGGQFVFWQNNKGLFPARLFYRWNILKAVLGNCHYLISKGLGDTLPIRYNCMKDVLFVKIDNAEQIKYLA